MNTTKRWPRRATNPLTHNLPERRYLPELHGVRGLALLGVVLFHLFGSGRTSGGIDIFLAVSGFLFTGMLLREAAANNGRISALKYYGRLFRRIVAPAAVVAIATLVIGLALLPVTQHPQLWAEARASLLYFENFELIHSQLAYGAAGPETSPFQHFWSLSVQGQFYIVWPVIAIAAVIIAKQLRTSAAKIMALLIGVIVAASLATAIYMGSINQDEAYLATHTRAWQLGFGGLLALAGGTIRLPRQLRRIGGWIGLGLVVSCGFVLEGAQLFPGPWALWPLAGLTLVLISAGPEGGGRDPAGTATRFLSNKPLAWTGHHAYALYLWHWPLLIFYMEATEQDTVGLLDALAVLTATVSLAILTHRFIELPLQHSIGKPGIGRIFSDRPVVALGAMGLILAFLATTLLSPAQRQIDTAFEGLDHAIYPGAAQYFMDAPPPDAPPFPAVEDIAEFRADYTKRGCEQSQGIGRGRDQVAVCEDENRPADPSATIVLAGGSHAGHLEAAFDALAEKYNWEVLVVTKSRCDFGIEEELEASWCDLWAANFVTWLDEREVDLVVTPGTRLIGSERILDLAPTWWEQIAATDTDLLLVRGMPRGDNIPDCLANGGTSLECGFPKEVFAETNPLLEIELPPGVAQVDVSRFVCPQLENHESENCDAIVGNVIVSYDSNHLTSVFSHTLAPAFELELQETLPHLF